MNKKLHITLLSAIIGLTTSAQSTLLTGANFYISADDTLTFKSEVNATGGSIKNDGGYLKMDGAIKGDQNIEFSDDADFEVTADTLTISNETDETVSKANIFSSGKVLVPPGNSLTVEGEWDNTNSDTGLFLMADATGYAQLLTTGTVTTKGTTYAEQYMTSTANEGWRQISSPVDATLAELDDDFQTYYPAAPGPVGGAAQHNVWWYNASPLNPGGGTNLPATDNGAASAKYWTAASNNSTAIGPSSPTAYNFYSGGAFDVYYSGLLDMSGAFGNGDYTYDCYQTHDKGPDYMGNISTDPEEITGWNLIPNPYPSNIDVGELLRDNTNFDLPYKAVHVWDAKNQQYVAIIDGGTSYVVWNTGPGADTINNIAPFQAFWVKAYDGNNGSANTAADHDIKLTNAHRTIEDNANYFKREPSLIRLAVLGQNNAALDQTVLSFEERNTEGLEENDAFKFMSANKDMPNLFSYSAHYKMSFNQRPMPDPVQSIPMDFTNATVGKTYAIDMKLQEINPDWSIYLEDNTTGEMHNLREGAYQFNYQNINSPRFTVHINKKPEVDDLFTNNRIVIYSDAAGIKVAFATSTEPTANVLISNLAGQVLFNENVPTSEQFTFPINDDVAVYVVHVTMGAKSNYKKIVR